VNKLKKRLIEGETLLGTWLNLGSPLTAEIVGMAGYDWVIIDLEHGAGSEGDALSQMQALSGTSTSALVRVESTARQRVHRMLDFGAEGIMFPHIHDAQIALNARKTMLYPPEGTRGVARMIRASAFGRNFDQYLANAPSDLLGIMQIETQHAVDQSDEIASINGVDVLFIGPADLTMEMGIFGQTESARFLDAVKRVVESAEKHQKAVGILVGFPDQLPLFRDMGIRFLACGSDGNFISQASAKNLDTMKNLLKIV